MLIYISCPVVNGDHEMAETRMAKAARLLLDDGHRPAVPAQTRGDMSEVMSAAVRDAVNSDGVILLEGWKEDVMCQTVNFVAGKLNKVIMYEDDLLDYGKLGKKRRPQGD